MPNGVSTKAREVFRGSIPGWDFIIYDDDAPEPIISFILRPSGYFVSAYYLSTFMQLDSGLMLDVDSSLCLSYDEVYEIQYILSQLAGGGYQ